MPNGFFFGIIVRMAKRKQVSRRSLPPTSQGRSVVRQHAKRASAPKITSVSSNQSLSKRRFRITKKTILIVLLIIVVALLGYFKKNWFVAAMVNNKPVTNFELLNRMNKTYRTQTLDQIINERVIFDEAGKKNVVVSDAELDERIKTIEAQVGGGESLDALLTQQRQSRSDLRSQLKIQITIEKLYAGEASPSAEELEKFLTENKETLTATEPAKQREEALESLKQRKLSQIFNDKFQQLKNDANIITF